jgi:hypothetical protein
VTAELVSSDRPIDIYARVSQLKRNEKREPSTDGQVSVCRVRLAYLGLAEGKVWSILAARHGTLLSSVRRGTS